MCVSYRAKASKQLLSILGFLEGGKPGEGLLISGKCKWNGEGTKVWNRD